LMEDGEIKESDTPKAVHESRAEFQVYSLAQFRGAYNRTKREVGFHCRKGVGKLLQKFDCYCYCRRLLTLYFALQPTDADGDDTEYDVKPSTGVMKGQNKRSKLDDPDAGARAELLANDELVWRPIHFVAGWQDAELTHHVSVVVALPGGAVTTTKDMILKVEDDGHTLVVSIKWPALIADCERLHKKMHLKSMGPVALATLALRKFGIEKALSKMRENMDEQLRSVARIPLKYQVQDKVVNIELIADEAGARVVYIDLKAPDSTYQVTQEKTFEYV
jgi:hypothetical protein